MSITVRNAVVYEDGRLKETERFFSDTKGVSVEFNNCLVVPGLVDVHVHLREPGFSYKETINSGTRAAAAGGYTCVCAMPNVNPVPDSVESLEKQLEIIRRFAVIDVIPYGSISVGRAGKELGDMSGIAQKVVAFSDDGSGVQNRELMRRAMLEAKSLGKIVAAHCEDESLINGGYIHDGEYAKTHGHKGISSISEWKQIERDLELVRETGCAYHVCHVSAKESVELIRSAKAEGLDISCETAPHYLLLDDSELVDDGRFKMNPPIRGQEDRQALIDGLKDGTIDIIATDHAPHSAQEKGKGLKNSAMGVVGLETAFPLLYTELVLRGVLPLEKLIMLMSDSPKNRFNIKGENDFSIFDLNEKYTIDPSEFMSLGRSTPFEGREVYGRCRATVYSGKAVWLNERRSK